MADSKPETPRSPHWPHVRAEHLKLEPTCQACGGDKDLQVHHVLPFHLHPALELEPTNLITLCETPDRDCHHTWGHFYDWKSFNPSVRHDVSEWLKRVKAKP